MSTATLAGLRVTHARVYLPAWGIPWAEVGVDEEASLAGRVSLKVADLELSGTVMSGGPSSKGRASFRVAGGAGGWGKTIPAKSYANDAGVKTATILQDAASACGETLDPATLPTTRPAAWGTRAEDRAASVLEQLTPGAWYVGEDGITRVGKRPATPLAVPAAIGPVDRARATVTIAAESIASVVTGVIVEGLEAVDVLHELAPGAGLRSTIWGAGIASTSRRLSAYRRLFEQFDPGRRFRGVTEYRVVTQDGERLNLQAVRVSVGMPDLARVVVRPGVPGARADVALGSRVLVGFIDADPGRPYVAGFEDAEGAGFLPDRIDLAKADGIVVREGDVVSISPGNGSGTVAGTVSITVGAGGEKSRVHA